MGKERERLFAQYQDHLEKLAGRVTHVSDDELEAAIDEAMQTSGADDRLMSSALAQGRTLIRNQ